MDKPTSMRQKAEENDVGRDRISDLPDAVLCHVLSFLPIKICVTTSILSRRWRHIWKDIQVLDFCDHYCEGFEHLAVLVNRVLAMRKGYDIRVFRLCRYFSNTDSDSVAKWVQTAIGPNLEELQLELHYGLGFVVPHTLFTCSRLVSLTLSYGIRIEKPPAVCLPSLKVLSVEDVDVDVIETLLSGCPALETLTLTIYPECLTKVRVPSSLKRLLLQVFSTGCESYLDIDAPGLEYLNIFYMDSSFHFKVTNLQHMMHANLNTEAMDKASVNSFHKLIRALSGTKSLKLGSLSTENPKPLRLQSWAQPTTVPNCLRSHLTSVQFEGYQGLEDELEFADYVLRYGFVLKAMNIYTDRLLDFGEKWHNIHRKSLYDIPRGSGVKKGSKNSEELLTWRIMDHWMKV
ncbi:F-box/LRR-repeat protein At3g26922-like [Gastrolobium bilobum]|uniref:F-box/LRR-repeat protein At3g26922-like n=1 Tax=Gastrolobium bilobum TaxID=150636 RepID=UPI002AB04C6B|nr:F-box/LRR-repeat protein At3g26922-like [Gastrolobium bilobum]